LDEDFETKKRIANYHDRQRRIYLTAISRKISIAAAPRLKATRIKHLSGMLCAKGTAYLSTLA